MNPAQSRLSPWPTRRLPLRQPTGLVASLLELAGLDWAVPDFSTLSAAKKV